MKNIKSLLKEAEGLRNKEDGGWNKSIQLLDADVIPFATRDEFAEANKIKGWSLYFRAIKDFRDSEDDKIRTCSEAEVVLKIALSETKDRSVLISAYNCLPLVLWIQGKQDEAWEISNEATLNFSKVPSVWNTASILCRWAKQYEKSVKVCEMVYETALAIKDARTAGHGKHNQGDALKELGRAQEAKKAYKKAKELYLEFEKTSGQKATVHINGVSNKLASLIIVIALILCPVIRNIDNGVSSNDIFIEAPSFFV
ncbi:MAG: hypothetical protein KAS78_02120 [Candidatus Pacebacteria bacterium]|nr:hypothetical protein [Candidatus Paceibacterota bacterium]